MKLLGKEGVRNGFFGQEINITTYNLCRINMFLHDVGFDKFDIECGDTLVSPKHWDDEPFELIVSNPPYSIKWASTEDATLINDPRFTPAGVLAPKGKADYAFIMHALSWLAANGTAAIVCALGVLFRGGAEGKIRKYLIENNFIDGVIGLPSNLFFGTGIPTCILVLKRNKMDSTIQFIDASKEFKKNKNQNVLEQEHMDKIVETYAARANVDKYARNVTMDEVKENDYNLNIPRYVDTTEPEPELNYQEVVGDLHSIQKEKQEALDAVNQMMKELGLGEI